MFSELDLPLSIKVWLATRTYDSIDDPNTISATTLLRPTKSLILGARSQTGTVDLIRQIPSAIGTSIHTAIESAWRSADLPAALELANINKNIAKRIIVNPETPDEDDLPVYMEIRTSKQIDGYTITGKFDFVCDGVLEDFKSTGTYGWINQSNAQKYVEQGSIYRWLNPKLITEDYMWIRYIFTDWSAVKARQDKGYPQARILSQKYTLLSIQETEALIKDKLNKITQHKHSAEEDMPVCTPEELWQKDAVYKYYKDPSKKARSTKNFTTYHDAYDRFVADGATGEVVEVKGEVVFCRYCDAVNICSQAQTYIANGLLTV